VVPSKVDSGDSLSIMILRKRSFHAHLWNSFSRTPESLPQECPWHKGPLSKEVYHERSGQRDKA
jgi:hypothetical protein